MTENSSPSLPKMTPETPVEKPRKIGCMTYFWVGLLVFLFLFWYNGLRSVPLHISPETTYVTEPLTPDNKSVDYVAAIKQKLYPPEMATDENGYRQVFQRVQNVGVPSPLSPETVQKYCDELGLDPNVKPDLAYMDFYSFCRRLERTEPQALEDTIRLIQEERNNQEEDGESVEVPGMAFPAVAVDWPQQVAEDDDPHRFPITQRWVEENSPALDFIAESLAKPVYFVPLISEREEEGLFGTINLARYQEARDYARSFHLRFNYLVGVGDIDKAVDDQLACYRLGRHEGLMVDVLVGIITLEGIASSMAIDANRSVPASEAQLRRLADGIRKLPPRMSVERMLEIERYFALDAFQSISVQGTGQADIIMMKPVGRAPTTEEKIVEFALNHLGFDWNIVARRYNEDFTATLAGTGTPPPMEWRPWKCLTLKSRSHELANRLYHNSMLPLEIIREVYHRSDCNHNMKRIALAMLIYERRNGTLPPAFSIDAEGRPLHSWRTLLLPYLGDESLAELYSQIRLDEPWDSEHNRPFHTRNLDIYRCPSAVKKDGEASYSVIVGDELLFGNDGTGHSLADAKRHAILLTERKEGICWMRPDAEISQHLAESGGINKGMASVSSNHAGGVHVAICDGSADFLSNTTDTDAFIAQIRGTDTQ